MLPNCPPVNCLICGGELTISSRKLVIYISKFGGREGDRSGWWGSRQPGTAPGETRGKERTEGGRDGRKEGTETGRYERGERKDREVVSRMEERKERDRRRNGEDRNRKIYDREELEGRERNMEQ